MIRLQKYRNYTLSSIGLECVADPLLLFLSSEWNFMVLGIENIDLAHLNDSFLSFVFIGLEVGSIRRIQGIGYGVLGFLGVGTTFDIFQNIHILYLEYGVLTSSGYDVLIFFPLWSLVSAGTNTPYLP
ncbi:hypothetical protein Tco_1439449 [Tanacetum coccineum]